MTTYEDWTQLSRTAQRRLSAAQPYETTQEWAERMRREARELLATMPRTPRRQAEVHLAVMAVAVLEDPPNRYIKTLLGMP